MMEIKHKTTGTVLFSLECASMKKCVEAAVRSKADLAGADLSGAYLRGADLAGADLARANLSEAYLRVAYLAGADLRGANLSGADLREADLAGAELKHTCIIDGGCDLKGDKFVAYRLKGHFVYCVGFNAWNSIEVALAYYVDQSDNGDKAECIARLELLHKLAVGRWGE